VKTLGESCFAYCLDLTSVTFESNSGLLTIEDAAFHGCQRLWSICLPASLEVLTSPFGKTPIHTIEIDANNRHLCVCRPFLFDSGGDRIIQAYGLKLLDGVQIPQTVITLGYSAFRESESLKAICIPSNVETIATRCFYHSKLSSVTFEPGSKLAVIEREAFAHCSQMTAFHIPSLLEQIDVSAFAWTCVYMISIDPSNSHFSFSAPFLLDFEGVSVIRHFGLSAEVTIPKQIQRLGSYCFQTRSVVERVIFDWNADVSVIGAMAFNSSGLEHISIPSSVVVLGAKCFYDCLPLRTVAFAAGSKLADIGNDVFHWNNKLARIEIPEAILGVCKRGFRKELERGIVVVKK
jgi:hypothetical protein